MSFSGLRWLVLVAALVGLVYPFALTLTAIALFPHLSVRDAQGVLLCAS